MKRSTKLIWTCMRIALGIGLAAVLLTKTVDWSIAARLFSQPWLLPGLAGLTFLGAAIESRRLGILFHAQGIRVTFGDGYRLVAVSSAFNFFLPGGTGGDVMKLYYLVSGNGRPIAQVATVLVVDRVVALFSLLCVVVGLTLANVPLVLAEPLLRGLMATVLVVLCGILLGAALALSSTARKNPVFHWLTTRAPLHRQWKRVADALYVFRRHKKALVAAAVWSAVGHVGLALMFAAAGTVLVPSVPWSVTCLLALLGMIANVLPLTPGGLGVGEAASNHLFGVINVTGGAALTLAWRAGTLPLCLVGCGVYIVGVKSAGSNGQRKAASGQCPSAPIEEQAPLTQGQVGSLEKATAV